MNKSLSYYVQKYFLSYLLEQRGYTENTLASYRDTFKLLLMFLEVQGYNTSTLLISDLNEDIIVEFLKWLDTERHNSISTKNVRLAHIISFYHFVMLKAPDFSDNCSKIINLSFAKTLKKPPIYLNEVEITHLLNVPNPTLKSELRDLALMSLLYDSACRVQELIELNVSDITRGKCCRIFVHGKGNKYREIPILGETGKILQKYITSFRLNNNSILFENHHGKRLTRQGVSYILKKYVTAVHKQYPDEILVKVSPHLLRHSKATHLISAGVNIYNIRDFLGHASVETTQIYLTSSPEVTRKALEKVVSKTLPSSNDFYSAEEKVALMTFLEQLI